MAKSNSSDPSDIRTAVTQRQFGYLQLLRETERQLDTVCNDGWGQPLRPVGMINSTFRPSDDATTYGFLIPLNLFAVVFLRQLTEISNKVTGDKVFADKCLVLSKEVEDANIPSLFGLPYLGCVGLNYPVYQNTRKFVWSEDNPENFTRSWFAWANTLFGELILKQINEGKINLLDI